MDIDKISDDDLSREVALVPKKPKLDHTCDICGKYFRQTYNKVQHMKSHCISYKCGKCGKSFYRDYYRKKHERKCAKRLETPIINSLNCKHCDLPFETYDTLFEHVIERHPMGNTGKQKQYGGNVVSTSPKTSPTNIGGDLIKKKSKKVNRDRFTRTSALNDVASKININPDKAEMHDLLQFFAKAKEDVGRELDYRRDMVRNLKWYLNARIEMVRNIDDGTKEKTVAHFRSKTNIALKNDDNDHNINEAFQKINASLEEYIHKGSNWVVDKIHGLEVHTVKYSPISASSYMELPPKLRFSRGVINIKNEDQKCFLWSILAALHPAEANSSYVDHYTEYEHTLDMTDIDFPVSLSKVEKFEKQNNLSINVFGYEEGHVFPLYLTKMGNGPEEINLLYLSDEKNSHYCWIKSQSIFGTHQKFAYEVVLLSSMLTWIYSPGFTGFPSSLL